MSIVHGHQGEPDVFSGVFMLAREFRRQMTDAMAAEQWAIDAGFRPPCLGVIAVVAHSQPISQREISDALGLDASDIVGVLDILEKAGLVERRRDPNDRRRHAVVLTPAGEAAARRFAEIKAGIHERVLAALDADEQAQLAALIQRVFEKAAALSEPR